MQSKELTAAPGASAESAPAVKTTPRPLQRLGIGAIVLSHASVDMQTSSLTVLLPLLLVTLNLNYAAVAAILSVNNLVIAVAQPLFGILGDRRPMPWLPLLGSIVCGAAMATVVLTNNYWLVLVAVTISGLGSAAFHPEAITRVRSISGDKQATGASLFFFGGNLGFALGPLTMALLLDRFGTTGAPAIALPTLIFGALLWSQRRLYARAASAKDRVLSTPTGTNTRSQAFALVGLLLVLIILRSTVLIGLQSFIPLYFTELGELSKTEIARLLTILALSGAIGTLFSGPLADRIGRRTVMVGAMAIVLGALAVFLRTHGLMQMVALGVAGAAITAPWTLTVVMVQDAMPNNLGLAGGLTLGTAYGASGLGVAALGSFADTAGLAQTMLVLTLLPATVLVLSLFVPNRPVRVVA